MEHDLHMTDRCIEARLGELAQTRDALARTDYEADLFEQLSAPVDGGLSRLRLWEVLSRPRHGRLLPPTPGEDVPAARMGERPA